MSRTVSRTSRPCTTVRDKLVRDKLERTRRYRTRLPHIENVPQLISLLTILCAIKQRHQTMAMRDDDHDDDDDDDDTRHWTTTMPDDDNDNDAGRRL